jgi:V/A-type H+-transporting ATPase subunit D
MGITIYRLRLKKMMEFKDVIQYSFLSSNSVLDEALMNMEEALGLMVELGGLEVSIKALADELRKIKRRVNVLERVILPRLDEEIRFIEYRLDEMEREAQFRIRRLLQMKV